MAGAQSTTKLRRGRWRTPWHTPCKTGRKAPVRRVRTAAPAPQRKGEAVSAFIRLILRHRGLAAGLILLSVVAAAFSARTLQIRFQYRDFYDYPANPNVALFRKDSDDFGDPAGYVVALVESNDVFRPDILAYIQRLTTALEPDPLFVRIRSLANVHVIRGHGDDVLTGPLLGGVPGDGATIEDARNFALNSALLRKRLVSDDGKATAVLAEMRTPASFASVTEQARALAAVQKVLAANPPPRGIAVRVTGAPAVEVGATRSLVSDQVVLMPAVMGVLVVMLFLTFRSAHGIILAMSAVGVATIWTAGIFALFGRPVDIVGSVIPTTILVYGIVDPIFVLTRVLRKLEFGHEKSVAIVQTFSELALPCFLTSLTTALGFAAFVTARAPTIRAYGLTVAMGVILAWVTTITVLPLLLSVVPAPKRRFASLSSTQSIDSALASIWAFLRSRTGAALAVTAVLLLGGGWLAPRQHIDNRYVDGLPSGEVKNDVRRLEGELAGVLRVIVHLEGPVDSMKSPAVLRAMREIEQGVAADPLVTFSTSLADLVAEANQAFAGGDAGAREVPSSRALIGQYLTLVDPADRADVVNDTYSRSHIAILLRDTGSEGTRAFIARLESVIRQTHIADLGLAATLTGNGVVGYRELDDVVLELLYGFITAFAIIVSLQWVMLRSLRLALISIVPNLLPVVACFLVFRFAHIPLKIDSALVLCVSIGGLFNTTIHFSARVKQRTTEGVFTPDEVVQHAMRATMPSALFTAVTLSAGFSVLLLSSFPGLQALGLLSMITLLVGFFSDMIVTAVLIRVAYDWKPRVAVAPPDPILVSDYRTEPTS